MRARTATYGRGTRGRWPLQTGSEAQPGCARAFDMTWRLRSVGGHSEPHCVVLCQGVMTPEPGGVAVHAELVRHPGGGHEQLRGEIVCLALVAPVVAGRVAVARRPLGIDVELAVVPEQVVTELVRDREPLAGPRLRR